MDGYRKNGHAVFDIKYHVIWVTKYRYKVLHGAIAIRTRELIRQGCEARGITILQGSVGKDHIHLMLSCPPSFAPSKIMQYLKGRSSRLLQDQFPELKKKYWGQHLWARGYFYATVGSVDEETIRNYIANQFNEEKNDVFRIDDLVESKLSLLQHEDFEMTLVISHDFSRRHFMSQIHLL